MAGVGTDRSQPDTHTHARIPEWVIPDSPPAADSRSPSRLNDMDAGRSRYGNNKEKPGGEREGGGLVSEYPSADKPKEQ